MGLPSHSIYVNELIKFYGAKRLIRIGSAGSCNEEVNVRDIVLAQSASTILELIKEDLMVLIMHQLLILIYYIMLIMWQKLRELM